MITLDITALVVHAVICCVYTVQFFVLKSVNDDVVDFHEFVASGSTYRPEGEMYVHVTILHC